MCLCHYCLFDTPLDLVAQEHHHSRLTSSLMSLHIKGYVSLGILWTSAELVLQLLCWTTSSHPFLAAGQATLHGYSELRNMILKLDMSIGSWTVSSYCLLSYYCSFTITIFFLIFLFFLLPHCILPHDKDLRCLLFIIGFY